MHYTRESGYHNMHYTPTRAGFATYIKYPFDRVDVGDAKNLIRHFRPRLTHYARGNHYTCTDILQILDTFTRSYVPLKITVRLFSRLTN